MIPLVLGGIALAAVGYGLKEYCEEEGCPWDNEVRTRPSRSEAPVNTFEELHKDKVALYEDRLLGLRVQLLNIENVDKKLAFKNTVNIVDEKLSETVIEDDVMVYAELFTDTLNKSSRLLESASEKIDDLVDNNTKYETYSKAEKKLVKKAYKIVNVSQKLLGLVLLDNEVLKLETVPVLKALALKIEGLLKDENVTG